jgi:transposase
MEDRISLGVPEQRRLLVLNEVEAGLLTVAEGAELLGLSERQLRRVMAAYRRGGAAALEHGNRGRGPVNRTDADLTARVITLARTTYAGFNQHHLAEMLAEHEGIQLSRSTVRRILTTGGISAGRRRRPPRHRSRRERYPCEGMLLQIDGSPHDWLEGRGPRLTLVGGIDDATGRVPAATFREQEDAEGYFLIMRRVVTRHGIPAAVYSDRHTIFHYAKTAPTLEEQLAGKTRPTQFGRLLGELGVQLILARSPEAKGRIERLWGTFQDRLCSELRLVGAETRQQAEVVLARYLPRHDRRFAVSAADPQPAWIPWPTRLELDELFCFKHDRVVARDNTVRFGPLLIDLPVRPGRATYARARVEVHERFDGSVHVYLGGAPVTTIHPTPRAGDFRSLLEHSDHLVLPSRPPSAVAPPKPALPRAASVWKPAANHPWKR